MDIVGCLGKNFLEPVNIIFKNPPVKIQLVV
jgi:hypothetical protein